MSAIATKIKLVKTGETVEIVPGQEVEVSIPRDAIPRYGFVQMMRQSDGRYLPVLKTWGEMIRMRVDTPAELGLDISYATMKRLITAGFIKGHLIAPDSCLLSVESLYQHIEDTRDPEFWTPERIRSYRDSFKDYKSEK